ncbi:MAG: MFS transporter [Rhodobacteraceae bacterium]|nr:MFS transporter [Paracoccaceae bacterium]
MTLIATNRPFRLFLSSAALANLGDGIGALAFPWLATLITRDPALIALVAAATRLPWLLLAIPAGIITDRYDRRQLMMRADAMRAVLALAAVALAVTLQPGAPPSGAWGAILSLSALAFLMGCAEVIRDNAAQTILPSVVAPGDLERANGQLWSVERIAGAFVGPPLAGFLIAMALPVPFGAEALGFAVAAWLIWAVALPRRARPPRRSPLTEAAEAWTWMRAHPVILRLAIMLGFLNAFTLMGLSVLVLVSQDRLGLGAAEYGLLLTVEAAGAVTAGLLGPRLVARLGQWRSVMLSLATFPLPWVVIALSDNAVLIAVSLFLGMAAGMTWNLVTVSYRQRTIPDALLGRVNSLYRFFGWGMMPIGAMAGGGIVALADGPLGHDMALRAPYAVAALGTIALALYGWRRLRLGPAPATLS